MGAYSADTLARAGAAAARILRERFGPDAELGDLQLLKEESRAVVARASVLGANTPGPSVIVKAIRDDPATGFSEWAALAFLAGLPAARGLAPDFLGGDITQRVFLMEDLGLGQTLHEILSGGSPQQAQAALRGLAEQNARLHAATLGREEALLRLRLSLPAAEMTGRRREAERWLAGGVKVEAWLAAVGCSAPAGFGSCLAQIADTYADPGAWLSFTHGDPAPSNNHIRGATVRLLDFEFGAFRHALYDITAWDTLCPLPQWAVQLMRDAFQRALAEALPVAGDAAAFARAWATLCAYRGLALLSWVSPEVLQADRPMVGDWSAREAVMAAVARTAWATADIPALAPVASATGRLYTALNDSWPELGGDRLSTRWAALNQAV